MLSYEVERFYTIRTPKAIDERLIWMENPLLPRGLQSMDTCRAGREAPYELFVAEVCVCLPTGAG